MANMTSNAAGPIYFTIGDEPEAAVNESEAEKESGMCIGESSASKRALTEQESVEAVEDPTPLAKCGRLATFESQ